MSGEERQRCFLSCNLKAFAKLELTCQDVLAVITGSVQPV